MLLLPILFLKVCFLFLQAVNIEHENSKVQQLEKTVMQLSYENNDLLAFKLINQFINNTTFNLQVSRQVRKTINTVEIFKKNCKQVIANDLFFFFWSILLVL
jgi:hypothetical protein